MIKNYKLFIFTFLFFSIGQETFAQNLNQKHILVSMRAIGHQILLSSGDSTSLVLPIQRVQNTYKIQFNTQFKFNPSRISSILKNEFDKNTSIRAYTVEVIDCKSKDIVYSYEISNSIKIENIACLKRVQPINCYIFNITIQPLPFQTEKDETLSTEKKSNYLNEFLIGLFIFSIFLFLYFYKSKPPKKINENVIIIGSYEFDNIKMTLLNNNELTELSSKETDLLYLLYTNKNTVVERDLILNQVWGDEGDYVGRTLDVFVSKLRKKLAADSNVKIVNSRGVGYKLID